MVDKSRSGVYDCTRSTFIIVCCYTVVGEKFARKMLSMDNELPSGKRNQSKGSLN